MTLSKSHRLMGFLVALSLASATRQAAAAPLATPTPSAAAKSKLAAKPPVRWITPRPPYPRTNEQGDFLVEVVTDATGKVIVATGSKPKRYPVLTACAVGWAKTQWRGPANTKASIPVAFHMF